MKINDIIKERRIALSLTQEQVALRLGISTPAVNKWEKGGSYPDITLLPALARLLQIDLNTLLSFENDLTNKEIDDFVNSLPDYIQKNGIKLGFEKAMSWIHTYPNSELLLFQVTLLLDGYLLMIDSENIAMYEEQIEALYQQLISSNQPQIRNQAISMLVSKKMKKKEFTKADELVNELPDTLPFTSDKDIWRANLYQQQEEYEKATALLESKLLSTVSNLQTLLMKLITLALTEERVEDAEEIAMITSKSSELFQLWNGFSYTAQLEVTTHRKDAKKTIELITAFLEEMKQPPVHLNSVLYQSIKLKPNSSTFYSLIASSILNEINSSSTFDFIKEDSSFSQLINQCEASLN